MVHVHVHESLDKNINIRYNMVMLLSLEHFFLLLYGIPDNFRSKVADFNSTNNREASEETHSASNK